VQEEIKEKLSLVEKRIYASQDCQDSRCLQGWREMYIHRGRKKGSFFAWQKLISLSKAPKMYRNNTLTSLIEYRQRSGTGQH
jgi:hypothetical protein